ncbi:MAG: hypothetical protein J0M02_08555, partial [Planctomycetes bacterium]|nr:hypothetical protein [Planctomycetota bacterium]
VALASGFVGAAVGALVLWVVIPAPRSSTVRPEPDTVEPGPVAPQPTPVRVEAPTPETPPPEPQTPPTAPTPEPLTGCPEGFVFVPAQTIRLRPYSDADRPGWPRVVGPLRTAMHEVPAFCIQRRRATDRSNPSSARTNLLHRDAVAACSAQGWRLPTVLEWESLARTPSLQHEIVTWQSVRAPSNELEWVADAFPAVVFQRPETPGPDACTTRAPIPPVPYTDDRPRQSWNRHSEGRDLHIGYRCVVPPR